MILEGFLVYHDMPRLLVTIGPNRFETEIAHVNDATQPTEINTDKFIGRVLVRIKDFEGVPPSDGKAVRDSTYFDGRTRKFSILIEGRFKAREGVAAYSGEEIQFGSDFDHIFTTFPRGPFNTGMRVRQSIPLILYCSLSLIPRLQSGFLGT